MQRSIHRDRTAGSKGSSLRPASLISYNFMRSPRASFMVPRWKRGDVERHFIRFHAAWDGLPAEAKENVHRFVLSASRKR